MKKLIALPILLLSFSSMAQINLLHPGMTLAEFHKSFPSAIPDIPAMTSSAYGLDTMARQTGQEVFVLSHDTVKQYNFRSDLVPGPSNDFPKADSTAYSKMMRSVREMYYHYVDMFGTPSEVKQHSPIVPKKMVVDANVFYAHWTLPEGDVKISVAPEVSVYDENQMNAPVTNDSKKDKQKSSFYVFEVTASGKGGKLRGEFEIGSTSDQFKILIPALASQVKKFPDCWMVHDTLSGADADWRFWFENNIIAGFAYDTYNGEAYAKKNADVYPILISKAKAMETDAEKQFGKPTTLVSPSTNDYVPLKKIPNAFFYDDVYYNAEWILEKDKTLFIRLHENGGKGPSFFHLEVYYGKKQEE
jgi:hypothetical protein